MTNMIPYISDVKLPIDDEYGSETFIRTLSCESFLGFRRTLREMNPGSIDIVSDYDCTGKVCGYYSKLLAVYKTSRFIVGVVETTITRDV